MIKRIAILGALFLVIHFRQQISAQAYRAFGSAPAAATSTRHAGMAGELNCVNGQPQVEPPLPQLTGLARAENLRHEATHGAQFAANCDSVAHLWQTDAAYRLALESEAQCNGFKVYPDSMRRFLKGQRTALLTRLYLPQFGFEDVAASLDAWCGG